MEKDWEQSGPPKASIIIKKAPHEEGLSHTSPEGIEPPLQEPESCVISFTLRRQYLIILPQKVVFGKNILKK